MRKIGLFLVMISASMFMLCGCSNSSQIDSLKSENAQLLQELEKAKIETEEVKSDLEETKSELEGVRSELEMTRTEQNQLRAEGGTLDTETMNEESGEDVQDINASRVEQSSVNVKNVHEAKDGSVVIVCDTGKEYRESAIDVRSIVGEDWFSVKSGYDYEVADLDGDGCDEVMLTMLIFSNTADGVGELFIIDIDENGVASSVFDTPSAEWRDDYGSFGSYVFDGERISFDRYFKEEGMLCGDTMYFTYNNGEWLLER